MADQGETAHVMTGFESMMWEMERDPHLASTFSNLTILDQAPDREIFRSRMERALVAVPRLRQRVVTSALPWELPRWVDDPAMDLDYHLRWLDMGGGATRSDLYELTATLSRDPLDRERPLWQFVVIEGLDDGRAAMLQRLHHTITDGEGGIRLSVEFLDFQREPTRPKTKHAPDAPADEGQGFGAEASAPGAAGASGNTEPNAPSGASEASVANWRDRTLKTLQSIRGAAISVGSNASTAASLATSLPETAAELIGAAKSTAKQAMVGNRRSPLWTERSLGRWFGTTTLSLEDILAAAHKMGGSVNDVFIAGAADAAGRIHERAGSPVDELRVSMPVSTRHDRSAGGNAFSPTQMLVPTSPMKPRERVAAIHEIVTEIREERAIAAMEGAANAAAMLPPAVILRTGQYLTHSVDFVCSNVRAAPFDLFIGGAFMHANYPIGPLAGTAFNLTTMSYRGWLFLGLSVDTAAVAEPEALLEALDTSYTQLLASVRMTRRSPEFF